MGNEENKKHERIISESEKRSYTEYINKELEGTPKNIVKIPIDHSGNELFDVFSQGILLIKLINQGFPGTIDESKLSYKPNKSTFEINENHDRSINACVALGCSVVNVGAQDLSSGTPHLILGLLWQVIKKSLLKNVTFSNKDLAELKEQGGSELDSMAPEQLIMQWMNFHVKKAGLDLEIKNFGSDLSDSVAYATILRQISPKLVTQEDVERIKGEQDLEERADMLIRTAKQILGEETTIFVSKEDIVEANPKLNLAFCATLFNNHPGLTDTVSEMEEYEEKLEILKEKKEK